jgi:integrase
MLPVTFQLFPRKALPTIDLKRVAEVQEWLGHSSIATTRLYDKRKMQAEDSPTFKVKF